MAALALLFLLGFFDQKPVCPPMRYEVVEIYDWVEEIKKAQFVDNGAVLFMASTGPRYRPVEVFEKDGEYWTRQMVQKVVGTTTDQEAAAFNKRVRECQTVNGEFDRP
jgi:hypothetical protein